MDKKLAKWLQWFETVEREVEDLLIARHTFTSLQGMIASNPALQQPSSFWEYLSQTYVSYVLIGLRRQTKVDRQAISFARLLSEMEESPRTLTRKYFVGLYADSPMKRYADQDFERFAQAGAAHIDASLVTDDGRRLAAAAQACEAFADRRIAHLDERKPKHVPTFREVDACINLLDQLCVHYRLLFHASSMDTLLPTWQYDWTAIFRVPWIAEEH
jgi:hypothetical protein